MYLFPEMGIDLADDSKASFCMSPKTWIFLATPIVGMFKAAIDKNSNINTVLQI